MAAAMRRGRRKSPLPSAAAPIDAQVQLMLREPTRRGLVITSVSWYWLWRTDEA